MDSDENLPANVLSQAEVEEIESLYQRITTPWRCRLGLHKYEDWAYMLSLQYGAKSVDTGRNAAPGQMDVQVRLCPRCMKVQARVLKIRHCTPVEWDGDDEDDD